MRGYKQLFCSLRYKAENLAEVKQPERNRLRQMTVKSMLAASRIGAERHGAKHCL